MGVDSGCGCKEVYRFPHITYPSLLLLYLFFFAAASLLFLHKNMFFIELQRRMNKGVSSHCHEFCCSRTLEV